MKNKENNYQIEQLINLGFKREDTITFINNFISKLLNNYEIKINEYLATKIFPKLTDLLLNETIKSFEIVNMGYDCSYHPFDTKKYANVYSFKHVEDFIEKWCEKETTATYISGFGISVNPIEIKIEENIRIHSEKLFFDYISIPEYLNIIEKDDFFYEELMELELFDSIDFALKIIQDIKTLSIKDLFYIYNIPEEIDKFKIFENR